MISGGFLVKRGACCRCGATGRPLSVLKVAPGKQPWLEDATPGDPDASACADCWLEVADVILIHHGVPL